MNTLSHTLPGTWKLTKRIDCTLSGEPRIEPTLGEDSVALIYDDRAGHLAAQFMKRDRSGMVTEASATDPNNSRAQGGYDAYFGSHCINDTESSVTQQLKGALSKENVGLAITRKMLIEGDTLTIKLETAAVNGEPVMRTLIWSRAG